MPGFSGDDSWADARREREPRTANDLIRARRAGRLTRRELIERAAQLGFGAGVAGVLLHATGDAAFGTPVPASPVPADQTTARTVPASTPTKPAGKAKRGGALTAGVVGTVDTLNPYLTNLFGPSFDALSGVMEGLLAFDSTQQLQPALAESFGVSDDGLTYTFQLRQGVTFHSGDPLTVDDVVNSWQMIVNPDFPAWSRLGWDKVLSIDVPDPATLVVTTKGLYAPFLSNIAAGAFNNGVICPTRQLKKGPDRFGREFGHKPAGTGPLRFVESKVGAIVLERFPGYWNTPARLDRVTVRAFPDDETQLDALRRGEIQVASLAGRPGPDQLAQVLRMAGTTVLEYPGLTWGHLDLKQVDFLRETAVRQALDFATPSQRIVDEVLGGRAIRAVADQMPGSWVYNEQVAPRPYSRTRARQLLDAAGLTVGADGVRARDGKRLEIELWAAADDPQAPRIVQLIAASWNAIGVQATPKSAPAATLYGPTGYQFSDKMTAGFYRWSNFNDPDDMYYWHSSQIPLAPGGRGGNFPAFFNPYNFQDKIDDLTSRAAAETDRGQRKGLYWEIQQLLHDEVPVIFIFWDKRFAVAANTVGGFWPSAFDDLLWNVAEWYLTA